MAFLRTTLILCILVAVTVAANVFGSGRVAMISSVAMSVSQIVNDQGQGNSTAKTRAQGGVSGESTFDSTSTYRKRRPPKRMVVSFVNGIYHTESEWQEICDELKVLFNQQEIRPFYNPSSGFWMRDALGAGYELVRRPNDLLTARNLAAHLRSALKEVGPNGRVLHLAHSGGAILTYLAAKYHLSAAETDRIDVTTFGGGRSITQKYFKGRIVNYYARNDPLVLLDRRAGQLVKRVPGLPSDKANITTYPPCEVKDRKHNTSFVFLRGVANNPIFDHSMTGPTYLGALKLEAEDFRQRMARLRANEFSEAGMIRKLRKQASELTGMHHFWGDVSIDAEMALRRARKQMASVTGLHGFFSRKGRGRGKRPIIVTDADAEGAVLPASTINENMEGAPALSSGDIVRAEVSAGPLEWVGDVGRGAMRRLWGVRPHPAPAPAPVGGDGGILAGDAESESESEPAGAWSGEAEAELTTEVLSTPVGEGAEAAGLDWSWSRLVERVRGALGGGEGEGEERQFRSEASVEGSSPEGGGLVAASVVEAEPSWGVGQLEGEGGGGGSDVPSDTKEDDREEEEEEEQEEEEEGEEEEEEEETGQPPVPPNPEGAGRDAAGEDTEDQSGVEMTVARVSPDEAIDNDEAPPQAEASPIEAREGGSTEN